MSQQEQSPAAIPAFDIPVIVLCGGKSSRMAERTNDLVPKHLLEVASKRVGDYVLEPFATAPQIILATSVHGAQVADYYGANYPDLPIKISHQPLPLGVVPAIFQAIEEHAITSSFAITSGDEVVRGLDAEQFAANHRKAAKAASLVVSSFIATKPDFGFTLDGNNTAQSLARSHEESLAQASHFGTGTFIFEQAVLPEMAQHDNWESFVRSLIDQQVLYCHTTDHEFFNLNTPDDLVLFEQSAADATAA